MSKPTKLTDAEVMARAEELLRRYPYDPQIRPEVYETGSPERLRGCPPGSRESLAIIYVRSFPRWQREAELRLRERQGKPAVHVEDESERKYP